MKEIQCILFISMLLFSIYSHAVPPDELYLVAFDTRNHPQSNFDGFPKPTGDNTNLVVKLTSQPRLASSAIRILTSNYEEARNVLISDAIHVNIFVPGIDTGYRANYGYIYRIAPTENFWGVNTALTAAANNRSPGMRDIARSAQGILNTQPQVVDQYLTDQEIPGNTIRSAEVFRFSEIATIAESFTVPNPNANPNPPAPVINMGVYPVGGQEGTVIGGIIRGIRRFFMRPGTTQPVEDDRQPLLSLEMLNPDIDIPDLPSCSSTLYNFSIQPRADSSFDACFTKEITAYPLTKNQATALVIGAFLTSQ